MTKNKLSICYRILGIITSIAIVLTGVCFMAGCLNIYNSGDHPYTPQAVAEGFAGFEFLVYITVGLCVITTVADLFIDNATKRTHSKMYKNILSDLQAKKDFDGADSATITAINKERKNRKIHSIIRSLLLCLSSVIFLTYALNINNFHKSEINSSMIKAMSVLIPCLAVPFIYAVFTAYYNDKSFKRELESVKQLPNKQVKDTNVSSKSTNRILVVRIAILVVAAAILVYGYCSGGTADVLTKAINICTECIGLG